MSKITRNGDTPPRAAPSDPTPRPPTRQDRQGDDSELKDTQQRFSKLLEQRPDDAHQAPASAPQTAAEQRRRQPAESWSELFRRGTQTNGAARRKTSEPAQPIVDTMQPAPALPTGVKPPRSANPTPGDASGIKPDTRPARQPPKGDAGDGVEHRPKRERKQTSHTLPAGIGDQILQSLVPTPPQSSSTEPSAQTPDTDRLADITKQLAQQILVSTPLNGGPSEVRIQLKSSVLDGAEVTISRSQGQILIGFSVNNEQTGQTLSKRLGNLQQILSERLPDPVRIELHTQTDNSPDQDDGRSGNRRDVRDEWDADDEPG